jgi:FixJ family two-component response regulator
MGSTWMSQNKINVAVVDDDDSFGRAIGRLLRAAGFEPVGYCSAEAFLEDTARTPPDCLVLDIHLGGASGLDLRRHLTALGSPIPVIFVTAHDEPSTREEAQRAGCSAYLRKPVSGHLLISAITEAVHPSR